MDFFEQQDQAHRQSKKLLFLFFLAVVAIVLAVNGSLALIWIWASGGSTSPAHPYPRGFFLTNTVLTLLFIGGGTLLEMFRLRDGGDAVAQMAGGRLVLPSSQDLQERRLLNIVEEMSLASGIACPRVYILDREDAINAFAAGYHQNEAVVAVTRGALSRLTRDELQGVIGHEFSHIMNGDMRMNVKLIGVLFGIQMLSGFGQELMYWSARLGSSRSRDDKGPPIQLVLLVVGAVFFAVGYVGIFFGRLIKSAVSRQREFLADASSVQFTRNPDGIGGALRKIGGLTRVNQCGSRIDSPQAEQLSHLFLGAARPNLLSGLFATHPPLEERLRRVYGRHVDFMDAGELHEEQDIASLPEGVFGFGSRNIEAAQAAKAKAESLAGSASVTFGHHSQAQNPLTPELTEAVRDPLGAGAVVYALLLDRSDVRAYAAQLEILQQDAQPQCAPATMLLEAIEKLPRSARLPLLDLAMPALHLLSGRQRTVLLAVADRLIAADQRTTLAEFVLQTVLSRRLGMQSRRAGAIRYNSLAELKAETILLLSLIALAVGETGSARQAFARGAEAVQGLGISEQQMIAAKALDFSEVKQALDKLNQLTPLVKPFLIRMLLQSAGGNMNVQVADLIRCICAAIDSPVPEAVAASYTSHHWAYAESGET
ncbi:M48 family metallopeptidase [Undibacterium sp.]|jgi:Zn-dependent protease with chaperone function|uniref:M48 family metallopeptidase n=1 Tax=Undibacterium sp. TaxID=1914977 RepID=UPI002C855E73|nr:M48 family metallopeptidase [Undibacterium sp.]HTD07089.1 M48 family metallopeptidase [Undibacterium sp.]